MSTLVITEYATILVCLGGLQTQVPIEPPVAEQTVTISGSSTASAAFNAQTQLVRLHTDVICALSFGLSPTAVAPQGRMVAGQTEFKGVARGQSYKVAVIAST